MRVEAELVKLLKTPLNHAHALLQFELELKRIRCGSFIRSEKKVS